MRRTKTKNVFCCFFCHSNSPLKVCGIISEIFLVGGHRGNDSQSAPLVHKKG